MASSTEPRHEEEKEEEATETTAAEDEDTGAQVAPIVKLQQVAISTGEENEDVLLDLKAKLYRFDREGNLWKERGVGTVKLLKHKESSKVRLVMRQSKTLKICANHLVLPSISMQEHAGNDKSCVWHATDFADGELKEELFCIRFPSVEIMASTGAFRNDTQKGALKLDRPLSINSKPKSSHSSSFSSPSSSCKSKPSVRHNSIGSLLGVPAKDDASGLSL
ncbi:RAN binding protein 1 [Actinidia rufa]|uniref:Ran-specific GTPase-activating protein n=1 Tax=Actinidia rufa TaxID=165716 RepID=A0A7J0FE73_9ERIC|nr:RAN binding protein 1 [Actinidia rufa]